METSSSAANILLAEQAIARREIAGIIAVPAPLDGLSAAGAGTMAVLSPLGTILSRLQTFADLAESLSTVSTHTLL